MDKAKRDKKSLKSNYIKKYNFLNIYIYIFIIYLFQLMTIKL